MDKALHYTNLGIIAHRRGGLDQAATHYAQAIKIDPTYLPAWYNLALVHESQDRLDQAINCLSYVTTFDPHHGPALNALDQLLRKTCSWDELPRISRLLDSHTRTQITNLQCPAETPFQSIIRHQSPHLNQKVARAWSQHIHIPIDNTTNPFIHTSIGHTDTDHIRLCYMSSDFRTHPMGYAFQSLLQHHDRDRFHITICMTNSTPKDPITQAINNLADAVIVLDEPNDSLAAKQVYAANPHILIDLNSHTQGHRLGVCAHRPAPIQITYLGLPGTSGADFFDYTIIDQVALHPPAQKFYSESLILMPDCYFMTNPAEKIAAIPTKSSLGLPPRKIILANFNHTYKIEPQLFDAWLQILHQHPNTILWQLASNPIAQKNLTRYAASRDINPDRLVFAPKLPKDQHLARLNHAHIALDTWTTNGHTSTADALLVGLPVITLTGNHQASRVATSMLQAAHQPHLITSSVKAYTDTISRLILHPQLRQLNESKLFTSPLFNMSRFTRNLETAYTTAWHKYRTGRPPSTITPE